MKIKFSLNKASLVPVGYLALLCLAGMAPGARSASYQTTPMPRSSTSNQEAVPVSRFSRRPDYRQLEKQEQAEQEQAAQNAQRSQASSAKKQETLAATLNARAVALGKAGHYEDAISLHEKAVQADPQNQQYRINLSAAYTVYGQKRLAAGDAGGAARLFRKALTVAPDNGLAGKMLVATVQKMGKDPRSATGRLAAGDQLASTGDYEGAAIEYQAALALVPSAAACAKLGDVALRYGQAATAGNWYRQALSLDPSYGPAYRQLGFLQAAQKDFTGAAMSLRKALICDPQDTSAGQVLVEIWRRQVASNPQCSDNHLGLAGSLQLTRDFAGAQTEYREVAVLDPHNAGLEVGQRSLMKAVEHAAADKHRQAAETLFSQGLVKEALAAINQAIVAEPQNPVFQFLLGQCLETTGNFEGAHKAYLACVEADPANKYAASRLKDLEAKASGDAGAGAFQSRTSAGRPVSSTTNTLSAAAPLTARAPASVGAPSMPPDPLLAKVEDAEIRSDYDEAISDLRKLAVKNLQNPEVHHRLAVDLLSAGQISDAIAEFRIAGALAPNNKGYAEDLEQAVAIHKKSLMSSSSQAGGAVPDTPGDVK